jgi:hypothetical protein
MNGAPIDAARVIADLRELKRRTSGKGGARRVCWGPEWRSARQLLTELLDEIGLEPEIDEAGNLWAYLEGDAGPALALGSHLDSVPQGGWLDGALGTMAALGVLRSWAGMPEGVATPEVDRPMTADDVSAFVATPGSAWAPTRARTGACGTPTRRLRRRRSRAARRIWRLGSGRSHARSPTPLASRARTSTRRSWPGYARPASPWA